MEAGLPVDYYVKPRQSAGLLITSGVFKSFRDYGVARWKVLECFGGYTVHHNAYERSPFKDILKTQQTLTRD